MGDTVNTTRKHSGLIPFKPGQSGNPKGRPKGSRNVLGTAFLDDMLEDWRENGKSVIARVRQEKPEQYLKVVASILPKDINLNVNEYEEASDEELIERLKELESVISPFLTAGSEKSGAGTKASTKSTKH